MLEAKTQHQVLTYIALGGIVVPAVLTIAAFLLNIVPAVWFHQYYKVGEQSEEECGNEYAEMESGRYAIFRAFHDGVKGNKSILHSINTGAVLLMFSLLIMVAVFFVFMVYWLWYYRYREYSAANTSAEAPANAQKKKIMYYLIWLGVTAVVCCALMISGSVLLGTKPNVAVIQQDEMESEKKFDEQRRKAQATMRNLWWLMFVPWILLVVFVVLVRFLFAAEDGYAITQWFFPAFLVFYIITLVFAYIVRQNSSGLTMAIESRYYSGGVLTLKEKVNTLVNSEVPEVKEALQSYFTKWIQRLLNKEVFKKEVLSDYKEDLWKYVEHRNGKELSEVSSPEVKATVEEIREVMAKMRNMSGVMKSAVKQYVLTMVVGFVLMVCAVLYLLFHYAYRQNPMSTVIYSMGGILALTMFGTWYGWFSSAVLL